MNPNIDWTTGWRVPMQQPSEGFEPNWSQTGFAGHTLRQVIRSTFAGRTVRIRLSNEFGTTPLPISAATIARSTGGADVTDSVALRFNGSDGVVIAPGDTATSDPAALELAALDSAAVTLHLPRATGPATFHAQAYATSHRANGGPPDEINATAFTQTTHSWYYISSLEVAGGPASHGAVAVFGDSIIDGFGSTNDTDNRFPDHLARRLAVAGQSRPVWNAGIGGNLLLSDSPWYGRSGVERFQSDVLDQTGLKTVIVLCGLNDIGFSEVDLPTYKPNPIVTLPELIAGHRRLVRAAHHAGVTIIGGTLLPMSGAEYYTATSAAKLRELNDWIRTGGEYDAVVDFNAVLADPTDPERLNPDFDSGDRKHPNDKGYQAMAEAVDLVVL